MNELPRVVMNCMIHLQALTNLYGPALAAFLMADTNQIQVVTSEEILARVAEVLDRPKMRAKFPNLTDTRRDEFLAVVRHVAEVHPSAPQPVSRPRDPDNEPCRRRRPRGRRLHRGPRQGPFGCRERRKVHQYISHLSILEPASFLREILIGRQPGLEP
jgi:hypothetical protein